jgi:hypothetical protein
VEKSGKLLMERSQRKQCQIEAEDAVWYQFGTKEREDNSQPGTEMALLL